MAEGSDVNYWTLVTILGPILLLAVIVWAIVRNRQTRGQKDISEQGTRDVYAEEQRIHEREPGSGL